MGNRQATLRTPWSWQKYCLNHCGAVAIRPRRSECTGKTGPWSTWVVLHYDVIIDTATLSTSQKVPSLTCQRFHKFTLFFLPRSCSTQLRITCGVWETKSNSIVRINFIIRLEDDQNLVGLWHHLQFWRLITAESTKAYSFSWFCLRC